MRMAMATRAMTALLLSANMAAAQTDASSAAANTTAASALDDRVIAWLGNYLEDGETRLFVNDVKYIWGITIGSGLTGNWKSLPSVCGGRPSIQTRSTTLTPNGGCPEVYTSAGVSCTCLNGYSNTTEWEFNIKTRAADVKTFPLELNAGDVFDINSLMTIILPDNVTSIKIHSKDAEETTLDVKPASTGWTGVVDQETKLITTNAQTQIKTLDLSYNKLVGGYNRIREGLCTGVTCPLKSINMTGNMFPQIQPNLFYLPNLRYLYAKPPFLCMPKSSSVLTFLTLLFYLPQKILRYFADNKFTNWTVSDTTFEGMKKLIEFTFDPAPDSYQCVNGTKQTVMGGNFCVVSTSTESASTPVTATDSGSSSSNSYLLYIVIGGCFLIAVLLFIAVRQRRAKARAKNNNESMFDHTLSFDTHFTNNVDVINDPVITAYRIPFKDIKVANCISKGGFGLVYSGVYNRRRVAIKRIRPDLSGDIKHVEAFMKEICLMASLNHPRIVEFVGVAWDTLRNLSAVTEFMDRGDLREVLHSFKLRNCRLTWENHKTRFALHIAEALTYLHSLNPKLIHRDLKSKNVLLNADMDAKLSDFGVSRERHFEETHMTAGIGTSFWIAPEVLLGKDYDERADIFSYGVVLSEIDTDDYPYWNAKNPPQSKQEETSILRMVATGELIPEFSGDCPKPILELALSCLHVDPEQRPTAAEVVYALQQILRPSSGTPLSPVSSSSLMSL
ncbi:Tkl protein kinase, partial [Globisporangium splendens]